MSAISQNKLSRDKVEHSSTQASNKTLLEKMAKLDSTEHKLSRTKDELFP